MHEHGLADDILDVLLEFRARAGATKVASATVQVSEIAGITQDALQAALDHCCEHHQLDPIALTVEVPGLIAQCHDCEHLVVLDEQVHCTECGGDRIKLCADDAVIVKSCECA